jgi:hypothetical protein
MTKALVDGVTPLRHPSAIAEHAAPAGKRVLGQAAGADVGADCCQVDDEVVGRGQRAGVIRAE